MAKVLVTGASGFIGWHVVRALVARGDDVTCFVRRTSCTERLDPLNVKLVCGDVTDPESLPEAVAGKSVVYHLAGVGSALRLEDLYRVNEHGTGNVACECARQSNPPVLVVLSSLAAAGPTRTGEMRTETDPAQPISHYGRSKRAGEVAARQFADRVPITVIRPSVVFGEADPYCLALFRTVGRFGFHVTPSFRQRRFAFLHAADLATLLPSAVQRGERLTPVAYSENGHGAQGFYFASAGEFPSYHELGRILGQAMGRERTRVISVGPLSVWSAAAGFDLAGRIRGRPAVFSIDKAREARAGHWVCSPRKAIDQLGFSVAKPLEERLRQTAEWYRREGWL